MLDSVEWHWRNQFLCSSRDAQKATWLKRSVEQVIFHRRASVLEEHRDGSSANSSGNAQQCSECR